MIYQKTRTKNVHKERSMTKEGLIKISRMVYKIEPFKEIILAFEVKVDHGGQRSVFEKVAQFNEKYCWKGFIKISLMVYKLEPFKDFIFASEAKVDLRGRRSSLSSCAELTS